MAIIEALRHAALSIDQLIADGTVSAGHITITQNAARFTLYLRLGVGIDDQMLHVQYDVPFDQLEQFRTGPESLCDRTLGALVKKLHGEEAPDPCGG